MPQHEHAERAEICTCTHLRYEEHVPPFGRCLIEDCGCLEYKSSVLDELLADKDMVAMCPYGGSHTAADCECDPHTVTHCSHGFPDGVGCMICDTDGAAEAQGHN